MSALANKHHVITPRSDFLSIDQKITFEMDNIEEKLQSMLQNRADAIDRELQERWPKMLIERRADAGPDGMQRHCLQQPLRLASVAPAIEVEEPRPVVVMHPSSARVIDTLRDGASLDRAPVAVGASPQPLRLAPSLSSRLRAVISGARAMAGSLDWSPVRSRFAEVLGPLRRQFTWSATLMMRVSRWSGAKRCE